MSKVSSACVYRRALGRRPRLADAKATLTKVLSLHPMAHYLLGLVQIFSNRAAQGITYSERALALDRDLSVAHGLIGGAKYFSGRGGETELIPRRHCA